MKIERELQLITYYFAVMIVLVFGIGILLPLEFLSVTSIFLVTFLFSAMSKFFKDAGQVKLAYGFLAVAIWFGRQVILRLLVDGVGFSKSLSSLERVTAIDTLTQPIYSIPFNLLLIFGILMMFYELVRLYKLCDSQ